MVEGAEGKVFLTAKLMTAAEQLRQQKWPKWKWPRRKCSWRGLRLMKHGAEGRDAEAEGVDYYQRRYH